MCLSNLKSSTDLPTESLYWWDTRKSHMLSLTAPARDWKRTWYGLTVATPITSNLHNKPSNDLPKPALHTTRNSRLEWDVGAADSGNGNGRFSYSLESTPTVWDGLAVQPPRWSSTAIVIRLYRNQLSTALLQSLQLHLGTIQWDLQLDPQTRSLQISNQTVKN